LFVFRPTCVPPKQPAGPIDLPPTHLYVDAGRLLQPVEWSAKYTKQLLRQVAIPTVGLLNLVIEMAEHRASFKH
jgi:hypothetical protein